MHCDVFYKKDLIDNLSELQDFEFPGIISLINHLHLSGIDINLEDLSIQELISKLNIKDLKK